jgi:hypothetical protein
MQFILQPCMLLSYMYALSSDKLLLVPGSPWTETANARCAILMAYNHQTVRFHEPKHCMNADVIVSEPIVASIITWIHAFVNAHLLSVLATSAQGGLSEQRQGFFKTVWSLGGERRLDPHVPAE